MKLNSNTVAGYVAAVVTIVWLFSLRLTLTTPWGFKPVTLPDGNIDLGILYNPGDMWSYLSWVQQYYRGASLAGLLYSTETHAHLLWIFPLWTIGKIAALSGLSIIGLYNLTGALAAGWAVFAWLRASSALGLSASARNWAIVAFVTGSGGSWIWHLGYKLGWAGPANGGDLFFMDFFPSTMMLVSAYHSVGLALLTGLWWTTAEWENCRFDGKLARGWLCATVTLALLLGFSRPYEPLAFLATWWLKTGWHGWHRQQAPQVWKNSLTIGCILLLALAPGIGWTCWISTQPVWKIFAHQSLALGLSRTAWICTLVGWCGLVALGIGPAWQADKRRAVLPLAACVLLAGILLGLGSHQTKLASGLLLGPILLAGWGVNHLVTWLRCRLMLIRVGLAIPIIAALLGLPSLFLALQAMKLNSPCSIDADIVSLSQQLPFTPNSAPPLVLTDASTGYILPGLVGARVWAGHWSLTADYDAKVARLQEAGLNPSLISDGMRSSEALSAILADAPFDYALLDRRCGTVVADLRQRQWLVAAYTTRWILMQAPPAPRS